MLLLSACGEPLVESGTTPDAETIQDAGHADALPADAAPGVSTSSTCATLEDRGVLFTEEVHFESVEGSVSFVLVRSAEESIGRGSWWYQIRGMAVVHAVSGPSCSTADSDLTYENSHHNWADRAELRDAEQRFVFEQSYDLDGHRYHYSITAHSGTTTTWGPVALTKVACTSTGSYAQYGCAWDPE